MEPRHGIFIITENIYYQFMVKPARKFSTGDASLKNQDLNPLPGCSIIKKNQENKYTLCPNWNTYEISAS
jgi:hypothetical protein